jgi:adenylate cyclase
MIMASPESAWLKSRLCEASVLFADIRGFTAYSEGKDPEKLVEELNDYFEIATRVIIENGGYVDKFIGDAVLGVFGVPVYRSDHRTRAVMAAVEIQRYLNESSRAQGDLLRSVGISVHSGVIVAGNIGSASKMEYTVIGDAVNVASRLNAIAGPGMTIISKAVYEGVQGLTKVEALPAQFIKGRTEPVEAYQVLALR